MRSRRVIGSFAMASVAGVLVAAVAAHGQSIDYEPTPYGLFLPKNVRLAQIAGDTAWRTALAAAVVTAWIVSRRLAVEEAVLQKNPAYRDAMGAKPRFVPGLF